MFQIHFVLHAVLPRTEAARMAVVEVRVHCDQQRSGACSIDCCVGENQDPLVQWPTGMEAGQNGELDSY